MIDAHHDQPTADIIADLVSVLPPRGHGMHNLAIWQRNYRSSALLVGR